MYIRGAVVDKHTHKSGNEFAQLCVLLPSHDVDEVEYVAPVPDVLAQSEHVCPVALFPFAAMPVHASTEMPAVAIVFCSKFPTNRPHPYAAGVLNRPPTVAILGNVFVGELPGTLLYGVCMSPSVLHANANPVLHPITVYVTSPVHFDACDDAVVPTVAPVYVVVVVKRRTVG